LIILIGHLSKEGEGGKTVIEKHISEALSDTLIRNIARAGFTLPTKQFIKETDA